MSKTLALLPDLFAREVRDGIQSAAAHDAEGLFQHPLNVVAARTRPSCRGFGRDHRSPSCPVLIWSCIVLSGDDAASPRNRCVGLEREYPAATLAWARSLGAVCRQAQPERFLAHLLPDVFVEVSTLLLRIVACRQPAPDDRASTEFPAVLLDDDGEGAARLLLNHAADVIFPQLDAPRFRRLRDLVYEGHSISV
jgi:hypothetical protein